jgi:DNA-binding LacI/PurR family transcriptional regulator
MQVLLGYTDYDIATEERLPRAMLSRRPEGLVVTGGSHTPATHKLLAAAGVPVVETWDLPHKPIEHSVGFSNAQAVADLAIAGFGGFEVGAACHPRLTTEAVDCTGIGRTAGELLLRAIDAARGGRRLAPQTILTPYRVEVRGSTWAARPRSACSATDFFQ